jgi:hypothetical protein
MDEDPGMTKEEAIKFANCLKNNYTIDFNDMADFCDVVIKSLKQQPCDDTISRTEANKVYEIIKKRLYETALNNVGITWDFGDTCIEIADDIETWIEEAFNELQKTEE